MERENKIVLKGTLNFSFGKNGQGLSDELLQIGNLINLLSKDNYVYLSDSFVDTTDDVYDLVFDIIPHKENEWMVKTNPYNMPDRGSSENNTDK